jgi:hypothetical protein
VTAYIDTATEWPSAGIASRSVSRGNVWAHLAADTLAELHAFARELGLTPTDFKAGEHPHYNLTLGMWDEARRLGAEQVNRRRLRSIASSSGFHARRSSVR